MVKLTGIKSNPFEINESFAIDYNATRIIFKKKNQTKPPLFATTTTTKMTTEKRYCFI